MRKLDQRMILIGGTVAVIGCLGLTLCVALTLFAGSVLRGPSPQRQDQVVSFARTATAVAQRPTVTVTVAGEPTQTLAPTVTSLPVIGEIPVVSSVGDPAQAVRDYYNTINANDLEATWAMLTDRFKQEFNCCAPDYNRAGYDDWWNSVRSVSIGRVQTVEQGQNRAVVFAELTYNMNAGTSFLDEEPYFLIIYDPARDMWLLEDKGGTPAF